MESSVTLMVGTGSRWEGGDVDVLADMRSAGTRGATELAVNADVNEEGATHKVFVTTKPPSEHAGGTVASFLFV